MATQGNSGSNVISGGNGNDTLNGGASDDIISGGGGNDRLTGGAGNDVLDGGSGSDIVNGDAGDDTAIYVLGENVGSKDTYDGGSGKDVLKLVMTRAEWMSAAVQNDIAAYLAFLAQVINPVNGEAKNTNFTFSFGLTASKFESLQITVDGVSFDPRDQAVTLVNDAMAAGESTPSVAVNVLLNDSVPDLIAALTNTQPSHGVVSLTRTTGAAGTADTASFVYTPNAAYWRYLSAGQTATDTFTYTVTDADGDTATATVTVTITGSNEAPTITAAVASGAIVEDGAITATGAIAFADVDLADAHTATSTANGSGYLGTFTASVTDNGAGDGAGSVTWTFAVDNAATQYLAAGQVLTQTYTVTVSDGQGGTVSQPVTVTITGTNDTPTITSAVTSGAVVEDGAITATGAIAFADIDLADVHTATSTANGSGYLGTFTASVTDNGAGDGAGALTWTFAVNNAATQYLAAGQVLTQTYTVTVSDGHGGTVSQPVTVTITGTNDAPVITAADGVGVIAEDSAPQIGIVGTETPVITEAPGQTIQVIDRDALRIAPNVNLSDAGQPSVSVQGHIDVLGQQDSYQITLHAGEIITLDIDFAAGYDINGNFLLDGQVLIFDSAGHQLNQNDDAPVTSGGAGSIYSQDSYLQFTAPADGVYTVVVQGYAAGSTGAYTLQVSVDGASNATITDTGVIAFADVDLSDVHAVSVTANGAGFVGQLTAVVNNAATGDGAGEVTWTFAVPNPAIQYLAVGQTLTQSYTVQVDDGHGGTASQQVSVTITGANDAPIITSDQTYVTLREDVTAPSAAGVITFGDVDLTDSHTVSTAPLSAGYLGTFTASISNASTGDGAGQISWNFTVDPAAIQFLAAGQGRQQRYAVTVSDGHGGTTEQLIIVTIIGTNDVPTITAAVSTGAVVEDGAVTATGAIAFGDVDLRDAHTATSTANGSGYVGTFSTAVIDNGAGDGAGSLTWTFAVNNASIQYLAAGQVLTQTYTVNVSDGRGGVVSQPVTVTITGTNDAPRIAAAASSGAVAEDGVVTATGAIAFTDADLTDAHTATSTANGSGYLGTFTTSVTDNGAGDGAGALTWSFAVDNAATQYLAAGQVLTQSYTVTVSDGHGGTVSQPVTVTITGTNDAPTITGAAASGALVEDGVVTATGAIAFADIDLADVHTATSTANGSGYLGTFTTSVTDNGAGDGAGALTWNFVVDNAATQYLAAGQVLTQTYTVTVADGHGGTVSQPVTVTITGTNDVPTLLNSSSLTINFNNYSPNYWDGDSYAFDAEGFTFDGFNSYTGGYGVAGTGMAYTHGSQNRAAGGSDGAVRRQDGANFGISSFSAANFSNGSTATINGYVDGVLVASQTFNVNGTQTTITLGAAFGNVDEVRFEAPDGNYIFLDNLVIASTGSSLAVTEMTAGSAGGMVSGSGATPFIDVDLQDVHTASIAAQGAGYVGAVTVDGVDQAANSVGWTFSVDDAALDYLAEGEGFTQSYVLTIDDGHGGTVDQNINVNLLGANDAPIVIAAGSDVSGAVVAPVGVVVTPPQPITFLVEQFTGYSTNDVNALRAYASTHTANYTANTSVIDFTDDPGGFSGELPGSSPWPAALATGTTGSDGINDGFFARITSTFSVSNADTYTFRTFNDDGVFLFVDGVLVINDTGYHPEYPFEGSIALSPGNHSIELFFFEGGGEASLELSVRNSTGAFGLLGGAGGGLGGIVDQVTDTGVIVFDDVDLTDVHTVNVAADGSGYLGGLTAHVTTDSTGAPTGQVTWTFAVDKSALVPLGATDVLTQTYTVTISDGHGGTVSQPVTVTVTGVNDGPVATGDAASTSEDAAITIAGATLLANDIDLDGDTLSVVAVNGLGTLGTVQLVGGDVVYTPGSAFQHLRAGETGVDSFTYTARDPSGATSTATVNVVVNGANDAPTAGADSAFVNANGSVIIPVLTNDSDPEGDALSVSSVSAAAHGVAVINANGTVTYTPTAGYSGSDSFIYTVQDAFGASATASVSLVVGLSDHDRVGGDVFLQGNYMEIGVSASGSLGTANAAPGNYHPQGRTNISYVVDTDGWTAGNPPRAGDFTLPGTPVDTIVVGYNGTSYAQDERTGRRQIATTTTDVSTSTLLGAQTIGLVNGSLRFTQTISLDPSATYYITTITMENLGSTTATDVRFMRSFDPDQDQYRYGNFTTNNDVLSNPSVGNDLAIARASGPNSGVSVNLVAFDSDARASNFGFANYDAYASQFYAAPVDLNGALVDQAITLTLSFGNLAAGQSATRTFYTTLNGSAGANDMLIGTNAADVLDAGAGNDIIIGLGGTDQLTGGVGNDRFVFSTGSGADRIVDFTAGVGTDDVIELRGFGIHDMVELRAHAAQIGGNVVIDLGHGDSITLEHVDLANLSADDFWFVG